MGLGLQGQWCSGSLGHLVPGRTELGLPWTQSSSKGVQLLFLWECLHSLKSIYLCIQQLFYEKQAITTLGCSLWPVCYSQSKKTETVDSVAVYYFFTATMDTYSGKPMMNLGCVFCRDSDLHGHNNPSVKEWEIQVSCQIAIALLNKKPDKVV